MKTLLVNPNRYQNPPVPPIGLEYLHSALGSSRHESRILDLCFEQDPAASLERQIEDFQPRAVMISVRNIDSAVFHNNVFFLDEIKPLVQLVRDKGLPSILGGSGFSFSPRGVLDYLGADFGVSGPGENAVARLLDLLERGNLAKGTVIDGWQVGVDPDLSITGRGLQIDYGKYIARGGIVGFETQKGCLEKCSYCPEGSAARMFHRNPARIVEELQELAGRGHCEFHLCDTEFNHDLDFCHRFLETLIDRGPSIGWVLYMKTSPYDEGLFRLLKKSGAHLVTLSVPTGPDSLNHAAKVCRLAKKHGIRLAVDFLCGFPGQNVESVAGAIEALRRMGPDTVGIINAIRLYPGTGVTRTVSGSPEECRSYLRGETVDNHSFIRPVFYEGISIDQLREIIGDDPLFKIEGFERTSNYERLRK